MESLLCDPIDVFDACIKWAIEACKKINLDPSSSKNRRQVLGECFHLIPFRQMDYEKIGKCLKNCKDLFNFEELQNLVITASDETTAVTKSMCETNVSTEYDDWRWKFFYVDVKESQKHWLKKSERCKIMAEGHQSLLCAFKLLEIRHSKLTVNAVGTSIDELILSGTVSVLKQTANEGQAILLKQHIGIKSTTHGWDSHQLIKLIKSIAIEEDEEYEVRFDFDASWTKEAFYAVIPQAYEIYDAGIIKCLLYCNPK